MQYLLRKVQDWATYLASRAADLEDRWYPFEDVFPEQED